MKKSALIIAFILVISILASSFSFAFASAEPGSLITDSASVSWWNSYIPTMKNPLYTTDDARSAYWSFVNQLMNMRGYGSLDSYNKLASICSWYNHPEVDSLVDAIKWLGTVIADALWGHYDQYAVLFDTSLGGS